MVPPILHTLKIFNFSFHSLCLPPCASMLCLPHPHYYHYHMPQHSSSSHHYHHHQTMPNTKPPSNSTNLASCFVATIFLIFILFKPQDPKIAVSGVKLPTFSVTNGTVSFNFSQFASVRNPNRGAFSHFDSSLQLLSYGKQVGFLFIPAGQIDAGGTQYMAATFAVQSFPLGLGSGLGDGGGVREVGTTMEMESRIEMAGRVRVLHLFSHQVEAKARCRVAIAVTDGSVLGFRC